ncbi:MAG TPA: hypothetical protein VLN57_21295 [Xanthobacteraceae bacterium]|nr:hypothetical protein [Xanthobacteraceae bacterium]
MNRDEDEDDEATDFDFAKWLAELGHGKLNKRLSKVLPKLVLACDRTMVAGATGTIVITLKVGAKGGMAQISPVIKVTEPQPGVPGGAFFIGDAGELVDEDPRQQKLPMPKVLQPSPIKFPHGGNGGKGDAS